MWKVCIRLGQAHRVAEAAETCATEGCHERSMRLLDEVETLIRDAGHLVQATIIRLVRRPKGARIAELINATDWLAHSVRGFLSGTVKKKLGHELSREAGKDGVHRYRITVL